MPTARRGHAAVAVNNKICVIGGFGSTGVMLATVEEYDPAADAWSTRAAMPSARRWFERSGE